MQPSLPPQEFVAKWRKEALNERSAAEEHFIDLGSHPAPAKEDPTGQSFVFEPRLTGGESTVSQMGART